MSGEMLSLPCTRAKLHRAGSWPFLLVALVLGNVGGAAGQTTNALFSSTTEDVSVPPTITWLHPPKGHIQGGTIITIYGSGFRRSGDMKVRFAIENEFDEVPATYVSESEIFCVSPERDGVGTAHVSVANDGLTYSAYPLIYIKGSGTMLKFIYDNSDPGCLDCINSGQYTDGLNPNYVNEVWVADNKTGPYIGGTLVTITAYKLNFGGGEEYDLALPNSPQRYNTPVGGPGMPHPHDVDPTSRGNGPPITATFYPHLYLKCMWQCNVDIDQDGSLDWVESSEWVDAVWHDYTRITCESPPMPVPGKSGTDISDTECKIRVTNNQQTFDSKANTFVRFTYQDKRPTISNIESHQKSVWPARGPFQGNTEVTVIGTGFLPSKYLKCRFGGTEDGTGYVQDDVSHIVGEAGGKVRYISSSEIVCISPIYGPASQAEQYPAGYSPVGSGAMLEVSGYDANGAITGITVISGGRGYATAPEITFVGGGGCCAYATATIESTWGSVMSITMDSGGLNYNQGAGAAATAVISTHDDSLHHVSETHAEHGALKAQVTSVIITDGGSGYLEAPTVTFQCAGGANDRSCFNEKEINDGFPQFEVSPGIHARAVAHLGYDEACHMSWDRCQAQGAVVRIDITFGGMYYSTPPVIVFTPAAPRVKVTPNEVHPMDPNSRNKRDPTDLGYYSRQGKGPNELDPENTKHGTTTTSYNVEIERFPNGKNRIVHDAGDDPTCPSTKACPYNDVIKDGTSKANDWKDCAKCAELKSPEGRGPLLPPLGQAFMDGSIKPGHMALIRVSNNYHKFGANRQSDQDSVLTHYGYRDPSITPADPQDPLDMGYWIWSTSGQTYAEKNKCRVSNNPPVHQFGIMQGHSVDSHLSLGRADDEYDTYNYQGSSAFKYLDGTSVVGAPGAGATANAILSDTDANCLISLTCYVMAVNVTSAGQGYNTPPTVTFSGGGGTFQSPAHGAKAKAIVSGGTVIRIDVDPHSPGISYTTAPDVHITSANDPTVYDAVVPGTGVYVDSAAPNGVYEFVNDTTMGTKTVGHNTYNIDQTADSVHVGERAATSNYDVGHGAFPGHPGNLNLGHPKKDCIYFLYSDIYVSPSGSDTTGQGTAGRPYRTIQKCIDAALSDAREFYIYKKYDGGDRDPAFPNGLARTHTESAGQRVDATVAGNNFGTPWDQGYTGTQMRYKAGRITGRPTAGGLYGQAKWEKDTRSMQRGFGYYINRDRCVLKDGVYHGDGNRELHPHAKMVQVWAENSFNVTIDCEGKSIGKVIYQEDRHGGEHVALVGSVSMQGVITRRCHARADPAPNYRPYYPGRPGYGPGAKHPNGMVCWPGATGCQYNSPIDGMAPGL